MRRRATLFSQLSSFNSFSLSVPPPKSFSSNLPWKQAREKPGDISHDRSRPAGRENILLSLMIRYLLRVLCPLDKAAFLEREQNRGAFFSAG